MKVSLVTHSIDETIALGERLGAVLRGGEVIELRSDLGGGKTTIVSGIAKGFGSVDPVASPSFTICNTYQCKGGKQISHFDFYRLSEAGIVASELAEVLEDQNNITLVEWPDVVEGVLPSDRILIQIQTRGENERTISIEYPDTLGNDMSVLNEVAT